MRGTPPSRKDFSSASPSSQAFKLQPGKIFVGGLSRDTDEDGLQSFFSRRGKLVDWVIMRDKQTNHSRGFGFVTFTDPSVANALALEHHVEIEGRRVEIKLATPKDAMDTALRTPVKPAAESQHTSPAASVTSTVLDQDRYSPDTSSAQKKIEESYKTSKIFVRRLPEDANEDDLRQHFEEYGDIWSCQIMRDKDGNPRGFGYVTFTSDRSVEKAVQHNHTIFGMTVEVKKAIPKRLMEQDPRSAEEVAATSSAADVISAAPTPSVAPRSSAPMVQQATSATPSIFTSPSQTMRRPSTTSSSGSPPVFPQVSPIGTPLFHSVSSSQTASRQSPSTSPVLQQSGASGLGGLFQQLPPQQQRVAPKAQQQLHFGDESVTAVWDTWGTSSSNGVFSGGSVWSGGLDWSRYTPASQLDTSGPAFRHPQQEGFRETANVGHESIAASSGLTAHDLEVLGVVDMEKLRLILNGACAQTPQPRPPQPQPHPQNMSLHFDSSSFSQNYSFMPWNGRNSNPSTFLPHPPRLANQDVFAHLAHHPAQMAYAIAE